MKVTCPACRKETHWKENAYRPFCSEDCKKRDLGNWATERYRIPGPVVTGDDEPRKTPAAKPSPEE